MVIVDNADRRVGGNARELSVQFLGSLRSSWWIVATGALLGAAIALLASLAVTPLYMASSTLYVTSGADSNNQNAYQGSLASEQRVASYAELASSDSVVSAALANSGLPLGEADAASFISAEPGRETVLLNVRATTPNAETSLTLVNAVARSLTAYVAELERPAGGGPPVAKLSIVTPGTLPASAVSPRTDRNVVLGTALGVLLGLVAAYLRVRFDTRVRNQEDMQQIAEDSLLGVLPDVDRNGGPLVDFKAGGSYAAESYRRVRANLAFMSVEAHARVILVTSPVPADGKSTVAMNLASVLSEGGNRVVLVDADLRRPVIATRAGLLSGIGLTNYLVGGVALAEVTQPSAIEGLDVIASGPLPPNPGELLESSRTREALDLLSKSYDYVVVDSAPVLSVVDAAVLSGVVDGTLLVVRERRTRKPAVRAALAQLETAHARLLGVILNGSAERRGGYYGYEQSYGSGDASSSSVAATSVESPELRTSIDSRS